MSKQKKSSGLLKVVLAIVAAALALEVILLVVLERTQQNPPTDDPAGITTAPNLQQTQTLPAPTGTESVTTEASTPATVPETVPETIPTTEPEAAVTVVECVNDQIQTPYFPLYYPDAFSDLLTVVKTAEEPFTLEFYAMLEDRQEQRLFDIRLSKTIKGNMGTVKTDSGDVYVDMTFYRFKPDSTWTDDEINTVMAMQEAANDMISKLSLEQGSSDRDNQPTVEETTPGSSVSNMMSVSTPYCALQFPIRWKDNLITEHLENEQTGVYTVHFYGKVANHEKCLLFSILFGGDEGEQLGVIMYDTGAYITVNVMFAELDLEGWSDADAQTISMMQEALNDLIGQLPLE